MATTTKATWTDFAILEPSTPQFNKRGEPVSWKVQRNETGAWRCHCPAFIFSGKGGAVRTCKHIRRCQMDLQLEEIDKLVPTQAPPMQAAKPVVTTKPPQWDSAWTICSAMLDQARIYANEKQRDAMVTVLATKLAAFVPTPTVPVRRATQVVEIGVRHIVFED